MMMRWMLVALLVAVTARGAEVPKTVDEILKISGAKTAGYKTWSAEVHQTINMMGVPLTLHGKTWFKAPRLMRTEMQMPMVGAAGQMLTVMGGDGITWQEMDLLGQKKVMKMNMSHLSSNITARSGLNTDSTQNPDPSRAWENSKQFMDYTALPGAPIDGQPMWLLEGRWKKDASANPSLAQQMGLIGMMRLHIGQQDGFTHRIEQFDKTGEKMNVTMDFTNVKFNEPLDDAMFQYKPPAGIQAIDMTDMAGQMIQQGPTAPPSKPSTAGKP
jgi:outer membrane lipoprotein-sorting protein